MTYCPQCGKKTEQSADNVFVCQGKHSTYINPVPGATVFIMQDDKVLFGVRSIEPGKGKLHVVGGFIDLNETAEECAIRECREEFGVDVHLTSYLGTYTQQYGDGRQTINLVFIAQHVAGEVTTGSDVEPDSHQWINLHNPPLASELAGPWVLEPLKKLSEQHKES